jgi:hypothetical protein
LDDSDTRFRIIEVVPVFPEVSVAIIVSVFVHSTRFVIDRDQVHVPSVARVPLTFTFAIPPVSDTRPARIGIPVTVALFRYEVILTRGEIVSRIGTI